MFDRPSAIANIQPKPVATYRYFERRTLMGANIFQPENFQQPTLTADWWGGGITPVKTEPLVLRAISELISAQVLTQQIVAQMATLQTGRLQSGRAFLAQALRAEEGGAFDEAAEPVRVLSQRLQDLEKRLEEVAPKKAAATGR
jgi:hypothetical protein